MFLLKKNVFLVLGSVKDCIYDLNKGKLYHVDRGISMLIKKIERDNIEWLSNKEQDIIYQLEKLDIIEKVSSGERKDISTLKKNNQIKIAWIEVCTYCNLRCIHCYNESSDKCKDFMSLNDFIMVCGKLSDYGIQKIQIIGGEPFCNKDIIPMLEYASGRFSSVEVFTNATLLNENLIKVLKKNNIKVAISVYSSFSTEHDKVTQIKGSYNKTIDNIDLLKRHRIKYRTSTVLMRGVNCGSTEVELFHPNKQGIIRMSGRGNISLLTPELLKCKLITKNSFSKKISIDYISDNVSGHQCFGQKIYVSSTLEVYPCVMERRLSHGNLSNQSLSEILKNDILKLSKESINECKDCEFRFACFDCRPDSLDENIYVKPYYCTYDVYNGVWEDADVFVDRFFNTNT